MKRSVDFVLAIVLATGVALPAFAQENDPEAFDFAVAHNACQEQGVATAHFENASKQVIIVSCNRRDQGARVAAAGIGALLLISLGTTGNDNNASGGGSTSGTN